MAELPSAGWADICLDGHKPKKIDGVQTDGLLQRCRERAFTLRGLGWEAAGERTPTNDDRSVQVFIHTEK
jgi:hypothetical protein